jgi:hypothetical protein
MNLSVTRLNVRSDQYTAVKGSCLNSGLTRGQIGTEGQTLPVSQPQVTGGTIQLPTTSKSRRLWPNTIAARADAVVIRDTMHDTFHILFVALIAGAPLPHVMSK